MKISVFWTWYVWLVTWTCLAEVWHDVVCVDIDQNKIDWLKKWIIPIYEPWLEELVLRNHKEWRLQFSTDAKFGVEWWKAIFNAVWTPPDEKWNANLTYVKKVAETFWTFCDEYKVFINKSTVPVGTAQICNDIITEILQKRGVTTWFSVVSNPEFLKEWSAIKDFLMPDRIVCGVEAEEARKLMEQVYASFVRSDKPLVITDVKSAELIKYAANSFLATKISFINEIANFAEIVWANVKDVARGIWLDTRIWSRFLHAWIWYGWSCFPKDVKALLSSWKEVWMDFKIIKATEEVNEIQKTLVIKKLQKHLSSLNGTTIAVWWVSFKPKTDDVRDAPSHIVFDALLSSWVQKIQAFDPIAMDEMKHMYGDNEKIVYTERSYDAIQWADVLILLTERDEFRNVDFERILENMKWNIIIDGRNIWSRELLEWMWYIYEWIWR